MSAKTAEQLLVEARAAWRQLDSARATIERLKGYRRLNADMRRDLNAAHERERDAYHALNRALSSARDTTSPPPSAASTERSTP